MWRAHDWRSIAFMALGLILVLLAGMNGLLWWEAPAWIRFLARLCLFGGGLLLVGAMVADWSRRHRKTLVPSRRTARPAAPAPAARSDGPALSPRAARQLLERELAEFQPLTPRGLSALARSLFAPEATRRAVHEHKTLSGSAMEHRVDIDLRQDATIELGQGQRVLLLARPERSTWYGRLTAEAAGERLLVLGLTKSLALLYAACTAPVIPALADLEKSARDALLDQFVNPQVGVEARRTLVRGLTEALDLTREQRRSMVELIRIASLRRPVLALVPGDGSLSSVTYSYSTGVSRHGDLPVGVDPWRKFKDDLRQRLQLPSKFVSFPMDRARAVSAYVLDVHLPSGLYVDETYVLSRGRVLTPMPRERVRPGYLSWTVLNGRSDIRVASWELRSDRSVRNPVVFVRMVETPPGSLFTALLVASAVLISVWLTGVAISTLPHKSVDDGFTAAALGVVTLTITLPGLLSSWWGIAFTRTTGSFRSLTGLLSLTVSGALALSTLVLYVARFAVGREFHWDMPDGKTIYLIHDNYSFVLFTIALVNVGVVLGLFAARLWSFQSLRSGKRPA